MPGPAQAGSPVPEVPGTQALTAWTAPGETEDASPHREETFHCSEAGASAGGSTTKPAHG